MQTFKSFTEGNVVKFPKKKKQTHDEITGLPIDSRLPDTPDEWMVVSKDESVAYSTSPTRQEAQKKLKTYMMKTGKRDLKVIKFG